MRLRSAVCAAVLSLGVVSYKPLVLSASALNDATLASSQFDVTDKIQIPGSTLEPGHYSIRILDHLSDRMVLQVESDQGKLRSTFLGLPNNQLQKNGASGAILYNDTKKAAIRGFAFSNGTVAEFVYPKAQAVAIARQNSTKVPAIDPPSEGMPSDSKLSKNDMALVTLWLLSPTFVGSESKPTGVLAQRYQAPVQSTPAQTTLAQNQPAPSPAPTSTYTPSPAASSTASAAPMMAQVTRKPTLAHLPHTAGFLPLVWLAGFFSLIAALLLRTKKVGTSTAQA